ncbi:hypothetical protein NC652_014412 [Populus alba x Populus x berolinensis]|nr:hypothetical protein NC652_014412 [Populus alba x Populus x berolinensis]
MRRWVSPPKTTAGLGLAAISYVVVDYLRHLSQLGTSVSSQHYGQYSLSSPSLVSLSTSTGRLSLELPFPLLLLCCLCSLAFFSRLSLCALSLLFSVLIGTVI